MSNPNPTETLKPFLRLNFATLWVRDQEQSRQFFVDQFGFQPIVDSEIPGQGRWIVVAPCPPHWLLETMGGGFPGIALVVPNEGSEEAQRIGRNSGLSFLTDDLRTVFEEWSNRGARFTLQPIEPDCGSGEARFAAFEDNDGNSFSLIEFDQATRTVEAERFAQAARLEAERRAAHDLAIAKEVQSRLFPQRKSSLTTLAMQGFAIPLVISCATATFWNEDPRRITLCSLRSSGVKSRLGLTAALIPICPKSVANIAKPCNSPAPV